MDNTISLTDRMCGHLAVSLQCTMLFAGISSLPWT